MKKLMALLLALALALMLTACGSPSSPDSDADPTPASDLAYVQEKGTLVVGITEFAPMDYLDADGNWIGFDADMAAAFAGHLGVAVEFRVIDWDNKVADLNDKTIDVVWNGMTLNADVRATMETSRAYFNNAQVVIVRSEEAGRYQTAESLADASFVVEAGSSGQEQADIYGFIYAPAADQATALQLVSSGKADAAIVDFLMAIAMVGENTAYPDLTYTVGLSHEEYGVGFRKGSDLAAALNGFFHTSYINGTMKTIARRYGIVAFLLGQ